MSQNLRPELLLGQWGIKSRYKIPYAADKVAPLLESLPPDKSTFGGTLRFQLIAPADQIRLQNVSPEGFRLSLGASTRHNVKVYADITYEKGRTEARATYRLSDADASRQIGVMLIVLVMTPFLLSLVAPEREYLSLVVIPLWLVVFYWVSYAHLRRKRSLIEAFLRGTLGWEEVPAS